MVAGVGGGGESNMDGHKGTFLCLGLCGRGRTTVRVCQNIQTGMLQRGPSQEAVCEWPVAMWRGAQHCPQKGGTDSNHRVPRPPLPVGA